MFSEPRNIVIIGLSITVLLLAYYIYSKEEYTRIRYDLSPSTPKPGVPKVVIAGDATRQAAYVAPTKGVLVKNPDGTTSMQR